MTTHVFIVDRGTFPYHLQYLFAGTGSRDKDVDFNASVFSKLYDKKGKHATENGLVAMMADCSRIREGDYIIFYLQSHDGREGRFYGIFKAVGKPFLDRFSASQFLLKDLGKNLTFRIMIEPFEVYAKGVTEWQALDEIKQIASPNQMLWSLIYRKLKGNRGNTMITIYESERLFELIRRENNNVPLDNVGTFSFDETKDEIIKEADSKPYLYSGKKAAFDILPRLIHKYKSNKAHEAHLQMYIAQNVGSGSNSSLDEALGIAPNCEIEWIGNEVSCGVGMQRIDLMLSCNVKEARRIIMPIELKAVKASPDNIKQIERYIDWIEQYYIPNRISTIQPVLLCAAGGLSHVQAEINRFNADSHGRYMPLKYIEYSVNGNTINFK